MPRNGTGTYSLPQPPFVAGTVISSAAVNSDLSDIASALTGSLPRDGQAGMTGQLKAADGSSVLPSYSFANELTSGFFREGAGEIGIVILGTQVGFINSSGVQGVTPVGSVLDYAGSSAPTLWYLCFGQAVSRVTYSVLFAVIGTVYGSGDGVTTFNLPDFRGTISVGSDKMGGSAAGRLTTPFFGSDPTIIGDRGGGQSKTLLLANLPAYTPAGSVSSLSTSTTTISNFSISGGAGVSISSGQGISPSASTSTVTTATSSTFTGTAQGGSSTAFATIQPSLIVNKIIYAGA